MLGIEEETKLSLL